MNTLHSEAQPRSKRINVLLSRHYDGFSNVVHFFSRGQYTHVSIGLEDDSDTYYSFNRKGFRIEKPLGWTRKSDRVYSTQYQLEVSEESYETIKSIIEEIRANQCDYKYSTMGITLCMLRIPSPLRREHRYFCSQFVAEVLQSSDILDKSVKPCRTLPNDFCKLLDTSCFLKRVSGYC